MSVPRKLAFNTNLINRYKLPPDLFWAMLLICAIPLGAAIFIHKFGFPIHIFSHVNFATAGKTFFNLWLVLAIGTAVITGAASFVDYHVKRELSTPLIGSILVCIALFDFFQLLIADGVIKLGINYTTSLYATWLLSRTLYALCLIFGTWYFILLNKKHVRGMPQKNGLLIRASSLFLITILACIIWLLIYEPFVFNNTYFSAFEAIPFAMFLFWGILILPYFHLRYPSIFSRMLVLGVIPAIGAELAMYMHTVPFDELFNTAYFLRFLSYLVPLWGISMNYIETISKEKNIVYRLDSEIHERLSAQKELEKREALLANAERIAHLGSWEYNTLSTDLKWSDEMYNIHGYVLNSIKPTMSIQERLIVPSYLNDVRKVFNTAIRNRSSYNIEYEIKRPTGELRFLFGQGSYLRKSHKLVGTVLDITELKEAQENLEIKIHELNRSNSELEQFAYVASHDLQEPLRKIKAFGDRLATKFGTLLPQEGSDYIHRMTSASLRMQTLIDDLLTFSRVGRSGEGMLEVNLKEIINGVITDLEVVVEKKNAHIVVDVSHSVNGISGQIRQLFQNLISNAVKFSKPGAQSEIRITSSLASSSDIHSRPGVASRVDYCKITVQDNGIGFNKEFAQKIFILFQRLHTRNNYEGTGIGLAVCKKIVDNHHGIIMAESEEGIGTTLIVFLPLYTNFNKMYATDQDFIGR